MLEFRQKRSLIYIYNIHILHWDLFIIFCVQTSSKKNHLIFIEEYSINLLNFSEPKIFHEFGKIDRNFFFKVYETDFPEIKITKNPSILEVTNTQKYCICFFLFPEKKDFLDGPAAVTVAEIFALELTLLLCMYSQKGRRKFLQLLEDTNDQSLETHNLALA